VNGFVEEMGDPFGGMLGGFGGLFGGGFHRTGSNSSMGSRHQKVEDSIYPLRLVVHLDCMFMAYAELLQECVGKLWL
jgi:hypothetical protein